MTDSDSAANPEGYLEALCRVPLFQGLPLEMLREAAEALKEVSFQRGEMIFRQGRRMQEAFYIVLSGRVRTYYAEGVAPPQIRRYFGPGDFLGETQLLTGGPALETAEAVLDTVTLALPLRSYSTLLENHPAAALPLARLLGRRLRTFHKRRRRTSVFIGVYAEEKGPNESLLVQGVARAFSQVTGSTVLVLDFAYGGPLLRQNAPGVIRSLDALIDSGGRISEAKLAQSVQRVDQSLSYLGFDLVPSELDTVSPTVFPALLGEAKGLSSYVLVRLPQQFGSGTRKLLSQLEHVVIGLTPEQIAAGDAPAILSEFSSGCLSVGSLLEENEEAESAAEFHHSCGLSRSFVFVCRRLAKRSVLRLSPFPREALQEDEEASIQARAVVRKVTRRRLGLCLGSGTALGWAHIGVLKVLRREKIPIDCISGSSMGSILASMVAAGFSIDQMEDLAHAVTEEMVGSWTDYNWPMMRDGLIRGDAVTAYLTEIFGDLRIEDLALPLVIQATDLTSGTPFYFRKGPVVQAVRASISLPGVFRPVQVANQLLVDGGVHDTLPTGPLRSLGGDLVLAVNTTQSPEFNPVSLQEALGYNVFDIFLRSLEIMQTRRTGFEGLAADLVIQPEIQGANWRELWRAKEIIQFGVETAEASLDQVYALLRRPPV